MTMKRPGGVGGWVRFVMRSGIALLSLAALTVAAPDADATTVVGMTTTAQAVVADRIFVGTVTAVTSRPKASAPKYFETVATFSVEDAVAGDLPSTIMVTFSGGQVGAIRQRVDGMPELAVGERYVVMLEPDQEPRLTSPFVGFNQGIYRVVGDGSASAVVRDRTGKPLAADAVPAGARAGAGEPTLDSFLATLRAARAR
jgi:hypothetical protein